MDAKGQGLLKHTYLFFFLFKIEPLTHASSRRLPFSTRLTICVCLELNTKESWFNNIISIDLNLHHKLVVCLINHLF